jgi:hypothetical protein
MALKTCDFAGCGEPARLRYTERQEHGISYQKDVCSTHALTFAAESVHDTAIKSITIERYSV